jgi:uncharacterized membrane protein
MSSGALDIASPTRPSLSLALIALIFCAAGIMHFVAPAAYIRIVPRWLPAPALLVLVSGVAEIAGGLGVLVPLVRTAAGWGLIALLVAVFPANVRMLQAAHDAGASALWQTLLVLRLPLQPLLIYWVWRAAVRGPS